MTDIESRKQQVTYMFVIRASMPVQWFWPIGSGSYPTPGLFLEASSSSRSLRALVELLVVFWPQLSVSV